MVGPLIVQYWLAGHCVTGMEGSGRFLGFSAVSLLARAGPRSSLICMLAIVSTDGPNNKMMREQGSIPPESATSPSRQSNSVRTLLACREQSYNMINCPTLSSELKGWLFYFSQSICLKHCY